jgi:hypothetical protein
MDMGLFGWKESVFVLQQTIEDFRLRKKHR